MLSFHLKGLHRWQQQEYHRKAQEIRDKGLGMTYADEQQMLAYERAAFNCMLNRALDGTLERVAAEAKSQGWTKKHAEFVKLAAQKGHPSAQKLLQSIPSNLPVKRRDRLSPLFARKRNPTTPLKCPNHALSRGIASESRKSASSLAPTAAVALRNGKPTDPAFNAEMVQRHRPEMVWPQAGADLGRKPDVRLEAHAAVQGRQPKRAIALGQHFYTRGIGEGARIGAAADSGDEGARTPARNSPADGR
jgi:hypothetical protein